MRKISNGLRVTFLAVVMLAGSSPAVGADVPDTATLGFEGTASLPQFPCPPPGCDGDFAGTISGGLAGDDDGTPWSAELAGATLTADFSYQDLTCAEGSAVGTAHVSAGSGQVAGVYDVDPLPFPVNGLTLDANFSWQRNGANAVLFLDDVVVTLDVVGILDPVEVVSDGDGTATAFFAPLLDPSNMPGCPGGTNAPPLDAVVVGSATFADTTSTTTTTT